MMLSTPLPALNDIEGRKVPSSFPLIVDAHVHIFPEAIFKSIWKWFDEYGWPIRYKLSTSEVLEFLLSRGANINAKGNYITEGYSQEKKIECTLIKDNCKSIICANETAYEIIKKLFSKKILEKTSLIHPGVKSFKIDNKNKSKFISNEKTIWL